MLKINPIMNNINRYCKKNTINARYNRNMDLAAICSIGVWTQIFRFPDWEMHDVPITAMTLAVGLKGAYEGIKSRIELSPIIKRAKSIKKTSKISK